jgi:DNA-binding transcriptional LysR family regulator
MAFLAAPTHPIMSGPKPTLAALSEQRILVRERGSGTRATIERMFKDAGLPLRIGSELSSNEAIKHMCAAGFGVAFLSLHTCVLELNAGVLALLPMANNPIERDWHVMHLSSRQLPQVALAFEQFLVERGQREINRQLAASPAAGKPRRRRKAAAPEPG